MAENTMFVPQPGVQVDDATGNCIMPPKLAHLRDAPVGTVFKWRPWGDGEWKIARIEIVGPTEPISRFYARILYCTAFG